MLLFYSPIIIFEAMLEANLNKRKADESTVIEQHSLLRLKFEANAPPICNRPEFRSSKSEQACLASG